MASSRSLGTLTLDLVLKAGGFTAGLDKAARDTNKRMSEIEKRAYAFGKNLGTAFKAGAVLATAALTAVAVAVGQAINRADEIRDLSIRIGVGTEALSEYAYAAKQTGTDIEGLGRGLKILSKNLAEAADPKSGKGKLFEALGVEVKDAAGNLKQLEVILPEIANKFKLLEDGTTKAALAQELFGKSGLELTEFLNLGSEGLDEMAAKARDLGVVISEETAAAADEFNDRLADLRATADGFSLQLAAGLLPQLNLTTERFQELVRNGDLASNAISLFGSILSAGVSILEGYNNAVARTSITMEFLLSDIRDLPEAYRNAQNQLDQLTAAQARSAAIAANNATLPDNFSSGSRRRGGPTAADIEATKAATNATKERLAIEQRLAATMGGSGGSKEKKKSGKSDAVKEQEQLEKAYRQMVAQQIETIALFGKEGEAVKIAYDIKNGELAKWLPARQQEVLANAEVIDQQKLMKELQDAATKASDEEFETMKKGREATDAVISDLEFEIELLGKSNIERAKAIELRNLDANATDEQRDAVARLTEELIRASENQQFLDDFKEGLADAFVDFVSGAKSAKEAFGDFADQLFKRALQFVADKAIQAMFDAFSNSGTGGGSAGGTGGAGFWSSILSAFGGGKAGGGSVLPGKFYRVNESGMEMATVDGRDYLMTGSKGGMITPAHKVGVGGVAVVQNFYNPVLADKSSDSQRQQEAARRLRMSARNGS